jgi:hypothetical protein
VNTEPGASYDGHVHFGDFDRFPELQEYVRRLLLGTIGILSLPVAGTGVKGDHIVNFNPEVLVASWLLSAQGTKVLSFGSLDNRYLLSSCSEDGELWDPAKQVREMGEAGFGGIKLWEGKPELQSTLQVPLDDPRLCAAYREAGKLGMPVLVHVADPPFFWTRDGGPWSYVHREVPGFDELIRQAGAICRCAPDTQFVFPHLLFLAGALRRLARFLDQYNNAWVDLAPGIYMYPALGAADADGNPLSGEQYSASRSFFSKYETRILFGSDAFFLSPELELLPPHSLDENCKRYNTLLRFLAHTSMTKNPFVPQPEVGYVVGLGLEAETVRTITKRNFNSLFTKTASSAPLSIQKYLENWATPLRNEGNEAIQARRQRVIRGLSLLTG